MLRDLDADGFKIDFTHLIPRGPGLRSVGGRWGLELLRQWLEIISDAARAAKPDALMMTHTANPYLADLVDMLRLNDVAGLVDPQASIAARHAPPGADRPRRLALVAARRRQLALLHPRAVARLHPGAGRRQFGRAVALSCRAAGLGANQRSPGRGRLSCRAAVRAAWAASRPAGRWKGIKRRILCSLCPLWCNYPHRDELPGSQARPSMTLPRNLRSPQSAVRSPRY